MPGSKNSPGRPPKPRMSKDRSLEFLNAIGNAVTPEDWEAITKTAVDQAKRGDKDARLWLTTTVVPDPTGLIAGTGGTGTAVTIVVMDYEPDTNTASVRSLTTGVIDATAEEVTAGPAGGDGGQGEEQGGAAGEVEGAPAPEKTP